MAKVVIGAWDQLLVDNRGKRFFEIDEFDELGDFKDFDPGNRIKAFLGGKGFFVFDPEVSIMGAIRDYLQRSADESCGKCTPCRAGTRILVENLKTFVRADAATASSAKSASLPNTSTPPAFAAWASRPPFPC